MPKLTVETKFKNEQTDVPEHIVDRTENLLSSQPMTNQNIILDTAQWWFQTVGNCAIYRWCIHHLDTLENEDLTQKVSIYSDAREQAVNIGLSV